jgi:glycine/D-amino acid oxidase-like deaminating enzyme
LIKERFPTFDVLVLEAGRVGWAASGRNGGFMEASLTHGVANGYAHWPEEIALLEELGRINLTEIISFLNDHQIDCDMEESGSIDVATSEWQLRELEETYSLASKFGHDLALLDRDELQESIHSPTYLGGLKTKGRCVIINPAKLVWGLARVAIQMGVTIYEGTTVTELHDEGPTVALACSATGSVRANRVILATNAYPPLVPGAAKYFIPVYDYALVTEPLDSEQLESIGWKGREGLSDSGNRFHYYRLTADNRILWGGYDAIYHYGSQVSSRYRQRPRTLVTLSRHFFETFPQLDGVSFSHAWGGAIDTSSRFSMFFGSWHNRKVQYALGFTGLGVGASRFAARVMVDLLAGSDSELTRLTMVRKKPIPFPPEPLRYGAVQLTRYSLAKADQQGGHRNLWLRLLDRMGVGFDS